MKHAPLASQWQTALPDVLLIIARQVATSSPGPHWSTYPIVGLSHVCRHWRHALISFPSLWNKIYFPKNIAFTDLLLTRSADCSLEIITTLDYLSQPYDGESFSGHALISAHIHRIRTITIRAGLPSSHLSRFLSPEINFQQRVDPILSLFKKSAPMLVSFSINSVSAVQLPETFLEDVAPNLKQLEISCISISYKMPIFKRVTHLCLKDVRGFTSVHQLIGMLENTSETLKVLQIGPLRGIRLPSTSPDSNIRDLNGHYVQFFRLKTLSLDLDAEILMVVLSHITTPSDVDWTINCSDALCQTNLNTTPLLSFLSNVRTGRYLSIKWLPFGNLRMQFARLEGSSGSLPPNKTLSTRLPDPGLIHQVHSFFTSLNLSEINVCEFDCRDLPLTGKVPYIKTYCEIFRSILFPFRRLDKLIIRCHNDDILSQFVAQLYPSPTFIPTIILPCPSLSELQIEPFGDNDTNDAKLVETLMNRKRAGHILRHLYVGIDGSRTKEQKVRVRQVFKNLAGNVIVNNGVISND